jgi:hypothetical protein
VFDLNVARFSNFVRRFFGLKGETPVGVESLLLPVVNVEPWDERAILLQTMLCDGSASAPAVAGSQSQINFGHGGIAAGTTVPILYVIEKLVLQVTTTQWVRLNIGPVLTGPVTQAEVGIRDGRWEPQDPTALIRYGSNAGIEITADYVRLRLLQDTPLVLEGPWVIEGIREQQSLNIETESVNQALTVSFFWRERAIEPSE